MPASASLRMATICSSVYRLFFIASFFEVDIEDALSLLEDRKDYILETSQTEPDDCYDGDYESDHSDDREIDNLFDTLNT